MVLPSGKAEGERKMTHTELHFMIENYIQFFLTGLLIVVLTIRFALALLEKWRGGQSQRKHHDN